MIGRYFLSECDSIVGTMLIVCQIHTFTTVKYIIWVGFILSLFINWTGRCLNHPIDVIQCHFNTCWNTNLRNYYIDCRTRIFMPMGFKRFSYICLNHPIDVIQCHFNTCWNTNLRNYYIDCRTRIFMPMGFKRFSYIWYYQI